MSAGADAQVRVLGAEQTTADVGDVVARLRSVPVRLPFDEPRVAFLADFSRRLSRAARGDGGSQALAFWLRAAELARLKPQFKAMNRQGVVLMPRGLVFHLPPGNVDTIFVYSMALSLLTGNNNIVRMSSRVLQQPNIVLDTMLNTLADHPDVAASNVLISYGHQDEVTSALSVECDLRVIWGGDATVNRIRGFPLLPHARDLTFPDRFSLAAVGVQAYQDLSAADRDALVGRFFNDAYWFDQMGCSSPRSLVWVGGTDHRQAAEDFHTRLSTVAAHKGYAPDPGVAIAKLNQAYRDILDQPVTEYRHYGPADTVVQTRGFVAIRGQFAGGGMLYQTHVPTLVDLARSLGRHDQTLGVFGIPESEVRELVTRLAGTAIDRIVPIGQALNFDRFWDGYDLLAEFTRRVTIAL